MRTLTIEIRTPDETAAEDISRLDVVDEQGRRCNGLGIGELIEQLVGLCHPDLGRPQYPMKTAADWKAGRSAQAERWRLQREAKEQRERNERDPNHPDYLPF